MEAMQPVATSIGATAWMNSMVTADDEDDTEETHVNKVNATSTWMDALGYSGEGPDEDEEEFDRLLDFSFTATKPAVTPEPLEVAKEFVEEEGEEDFDQLIDINFTANKRAVVSEVVDAPPAGVVNWMDMMVPAADDDGEEETFVAVYGIANRQFAFGQVG